jgi:hypothetical protein
MEGDGIISDEMIEKLAECGQVGDQLSDLRRGGKRG